MVDFTHEHLETPIQPNWGESMAYWSPLRRTLFIVSISAGSWVFVLGLGYVVTRLI
jgi:hypothetical protein